MAFNKHRLVVDPVTETKRARLRLNLIPISAARPPAPYVYVDPVDGVTAVSQAATYKGQLRLFRDLASDRNILMVAVEISTPNPTGGPASTVLEWKEVRTTWQYVDNLTGEEFRAL